MCSARWRATPWRTRTLWFTAETTVLYDKCPCVGPQHKVDVRRILHGDGVTESIDKNHDGIYDREELSELAKGNVDGLKEFEYFTRPTLDGKEVKLGDARDYWLEHKNTVASVAAAHWPRTKSPACFSNVKTPDDEDAFDGFGARVQQADKSGTDASIES